VSLIGNLVSHIDGGTQAEGVREQGAQKAIWAKRNEGPGEYRRLRNKELYDLYSSPNIISVTRIQKNETGGAHVGFRWGRSEGMNY
jgi:hypothetical protein